jgi:hypothetical protein
MRFLVLVLAVISAAISAINAQRLSADDLYNLAIAAKDK